MELLGTTIRKLSTERKLPLRTVASRLKMDTSFLSKIERNERSPTKEQIMNEPGVSKIYRPAGTQFRLHIPLDPEEARIQEERRLQKKDFDPKKLSPEKWVPVGPEMD